MVAVVSGAGLGLSTSSLAKLGSAGADGNAVNGRGGELVYVNSTTGNLVIQETDETMLGLGSALSLVRTYNSQGQFSGGEGNNWQLGPQESLATLTGTLNTAGSTITKLFGDGSQVVYRYDATLGKYVNTDTAGPADTLAYSATTLHWTWTQGSSRAIETYNASGQLLTSQDAAGNKLTYGYSGAFLTQITDTSGQITYLDYTGANLSDVRVVSLGVTQTRTRYGYDALNRLTTVTVDLSPTDNSIADGKTYVTRYAYDGTSNRIATVTQSDGSTVSFTYQQISGAYRVATYATSAQGPVTLNANTGALTTTKTVSSTTTYNLNTGAVIPQGWSAATIPGLSATAIINNVQYDGSGNGFVLWIDNSAGTYTSGVLRYDASTNTWASWGGAVTVPAIGGSWPTGNVALSVDSAGNAMVAFVQQAGAAQSLYSERFTATSHAWGAAQLIDTSATNRSLNYVQIASNGPYAAVIYTTDLLVAAGTVPSYQTILNAATYNSGVWGPPQHIDDDIASYTTLYDTANYVGIDASGRATIFWEKVNGSAYSVNWTQSTAGSNTWSAHQVLDQSLYTYDAVSTEGLQVAGNGTALATWNHSYGTSGTPTQVLSASFNPSTASWSAPQALGALATYGTGGAVLDSNGNGIVANVTPVSTATGTAYEMIAQLYNPALGSWAAPVAISAPGDSASAFSGYLTYAVNGSNAAVGWAQALTGGTYSYRVARYVNGTWQAPVTALASIPYPTFYNHPTLAVDPSGDVIVLAGTGGQAAAYWSDNSWVVPAGATWTTAAQTLYGVSNGGAALQSYYGNSALTAGTRLRNLPATLAVTTTTTVPITPYYTVLAADSWASITQAVYGTSDPNAIAALQQALGSPALTPGAQWTVPLTLSFVATSTARVSLLTYSNPVAGSTITQRTDIVDALGQQTSYVHDAGGRLLTVLSPVTQGVRLETDYAYTVGQLTSITVDPTGLNQVTKFSYDAQGNLLLRTDAAGNTVSRTYSADDQVLTETELAAPAPGLTPVPLTTRYVYDTQDHLRFIVSSDGQVHEYRYNAAGLRTADIKYTAVPYTVSGLTATTALSLAQLTTWVTGQTAQSLSATLRTDFTYDFRGQLTTATAYGSVDGTGAGVATAASVVQYVYDQRGGLLQTIDPRGSATAANPATANIPYATTYLHDGLGRVTSTTQWVATGTTQTTTTLYDDANRRTVTTYANGLVSTLLYDRTGALISATNTGPSSQSLGVTAYAYDANNQLRMATDADGVRSYLIYDEVGRKVGSIDGTGALTQYTYDAAGELVKTVHYAVLVPAATLASLVDASGNPTNMPLATILTAIGRSAGPVAGSDQVSRNVYDAAGRLVDTISPAGNVTQYTYDGANRAIAETQYATAIAIAPAVGVVAPSAVTVTATANDRHTRNFYDDDGHLVGVLNPGGYLTEYVYDDAGELVRQIGYYTPTNSTYWTSGTLAQLRPALDATHDINHYNFYDSEGRQTAALDGEGYLTETVYDTAGNVHQTIRYGAKVTYTAGSTLAGLRPTAGGSHATTFQYDGEGHLLSQSDYLTTTTAYAYDAVGNQISATGAQGTTDARTTQVRYDVQGRVTQTLSGEGSTHLTAGMTQAQIDAVWTQYGAHYSYDLDGRRISATSEAYDPISGLTQTSTSLYYFDADGRLRFTVDPVGDVTETRYNALGQVSDQIAYRTPIATAGLTGGLLTAALTTQLTASASSALDAHTTYTYSIDGQVAQRTTAEGSSVAQIYDAFDEVTQKTQQIDATHSVVEKFQYDTRGDLTVTQQDPTGINRTQTDSYDAFGHLTASKDQGGATTTTSYDRLGRVTGTKTPLLETNAISYDAYGRILSTTDALIQTSNYSYDDVKHTATVTTPQSVKVTTAYNEFGQTLAVTDGDGNTSQFTYDHDGALLLATDPLGQTVAHAYDSGGRDVGDYNASGTLTHITYDAANRVLTSTLDPNGLALKTSYTYDALGRVTQSIEPSGKTTVNTYDRDSRITSVTVDPAGLNLQTTYGYDLAGNVLLVTEGAGSANPRRTQYTYDLLGRRTSQIVDPTALGGTLNLTTQYRYDTNGRLTRTIDPALNSTWFVHDADGRLTYMVDALGGVTHTLYDANGRVVGTLRYALPVSTATFGDVVTGVTIVTNAADELTQTVYDTDGRNAYSINAAGDVTERRFDGNGNVTRVIEYARPVALATYASTAAIQTAVTAAGNTAGTPAAADHVHYAAYDARNRTAFTVDGLGAVSRNTYDALGNLVQSIAFATLDPAGATDLTSLQTWAASNASPTQDRLTQHWYDTTGRLRFTLDAVGYLTEERYNDSARTQTRIVYANPPTLASGATYTQVVAAAASVATLPGNATTVSYHDMDGRLSKVVDALANTQSYAYDAVGNKVSYTDQNNATWTYAYDADHRLTHEYSPTVNVTTVSGADSGALTVATASNVRLDTYLQYDGLGNVKSRTEANGTTSARTTTYDYDLLGRQTGLHYPAAGVYNSAADNLNNSGTAVVRTETAPQSASTQVTYDALGHAFRSLDASGHYSFNVYDNLGRVLYAVDAAGDVTSYAYDAFGNKLQVTRYAAALTSALPTTTTTIVATDVTSRLTVAAAADRTITMTYDRENRQAQVVQPATFSFDATAASPGGTTFTAGATTISTYNAFGETVLSKRLINPVAGTYASTYFYYDRRGLRSAQVDPLGYLTTYAYDQSGNVQQQTEFATALAGGSWSIASHPAGTSVTPPVATLPATGYDRTTVYTYDQLNRKTSTSLINVQYSYVNTFGIVTSTTGSYVTLSTYDGVGNQTSVAVQGATSYFYYDALGRQIGSAAPARDRGDGTVILPYAATLHDAFGDVVEQIQYANSATGVINTTAPPSVTASAADEVTLAETDAMGHVLRQVDPTGASTYNSYDVAGHLVKEWQPVTNQVVTNAAATLNQTLVTAYQYDALGRRTSITQPQLLPSGTGDTTPVTLVKSATTYDAFGEITSQQTSVNGVAEVAQTSEYDQAGHLWRTNGGDGIETVYLYNLAGQAAARIRSQSLNLASYASASLVNPLSAVERTENAYDAGGNLIQQREPSFTVQSTQDLIDAQPTIGVLSTAVPPQAVYTAYSIFNGTYYIASPTAWASGGGYYQVSPPSAQNPRGTYQREAQASFSVVQANQLHWAAPTDPQVVATFQYWPAATPTAVSSIAVYTVGIGQIGVNLQALASGQYGYRISYTRTGATAAFATQTGTFNTATSAVAVGTGTSTAQVEAPATTQTFDRWGELAASQDAAGNVTEYRYDQLGKLIAKLLPTVNIVNTTPTITQIVGRPEDINSYDAAGNLLQTQDANGSQTIATYNAAGERIALQDADSGAFSGGAISHYIYDVFGNLRQTTDQLGYRTRNVYDADNRLVQTAQEITLAAFTSADPTNTSAVNAANVAWQYYGYDQGGRRITATDANGHVTRYWYDLLGNVVRERTPLGFDTTYGYNAEGRKTSQTDANASTESWVYDPFGHLQSNTDLANKTTAGAAYGSGGGATYAYHYDLAGDLKSQTSSLGENLAYAYDEAGHVASVTNTGTAVTNAGVSSSSGLTKYSYDLQGRTARETVTVGGLVQEDTRSTYDALGRVSALDDPRYRTTYSYDAAGNRTLITANYFDHNNVQQSQSLWYRYDAMNRVIISDGVETTGAVPDITFNNSQGTIITYDAKGERSSATTYQPRMQIDHYLKGGVLQYSQYASVTPTSGGAPDYYSYDGLGRLLTTSEQTDETNYDLTTGNSIGGGWYSIVVDKRVYDKAGQVVSETTSSPVALNLVSNTTTTNYDAGGRATGNSTTQISTAAGSKTITQSVVTFGMAAPTLTGGAYVWSIGYDSANVLRGYTAAVYDSTGTYQYTTTYKTSYRLGASYQETGQSASSAGTGSSIPSSGSTAWSYNVDGALVQYADSQNPARTRYFANNLAGNAITAIQGQFDGTSGRPTLAQAWSAAINRTAIGGNYNAELAQYFFYQGANYVGEFGQLQGSSGVFQANFDVNYTPVSPSYPASTPSQVIAQAGDTLSIIAARVFGDASLWYLIAQQNGLTDPNAVVPSGTALTIPNQVVSLRNSAGSYKPFDVASAIGNTTPTQPVPPPPQQGGGGGCGALGEILIAVVAIVVTIYTAGAASEALASDFASLSSVSGTFGAGVTALAGGGYSAAIDVAAAAIGGAVGSAAGQGTAIAIGQQSSFNWGAVAGAAIGAGIGTGLGSLGAEGVAGRVGITNTIAQEAFNAALGASINQGVNIALGVQKSFNWESVAAAAVAAPIAAAVAPKVQAAATVDFGSSSIGSLAGRLAGAAINELAYAAFSGGKLNYVQVAADNFGNALGNSVVDATIPPPALEEVKVTAARIPDAGDVSDAAATIAAPSPGGAAAAAAQAVESVPTNTAASVATGVSTQNDTTVQSDAPTPLDEIVVTARRMTGAEARAYDARQALEAVVNATLEAHQREETARQRVLNEMSLGQRVLVATGGILYNGYQSLASGVRSVVSLANSAGEFQQRVLGDLLHGDFQTAAGEYVGLAGSVVTDAKALATGLQNVATVLGDPQSRQVLVDFASKYYNTSTEVTQSELLGALPVQLLIAAGTAGAGDALSGAGVAERIGGVLGDLANALRSVEFSGSSGGSTLANQIGAIGADVSGAGRLGATVAEATAPLSQIEINAQNGAAFQARVSAYGGDTLNNFVEELSIKPNTANGPADFRIRLDGFGADPNTNGFAGLEAKSSETAPLTQNQTPGFELLKNYGGTIVGKAGGTVYPAGTAIPPTEVQIIRPSNLPPGY